MITFYTWISCNHFRCEALTPLEYFFKADSKIDFVRSVLPPLEAEAFFIYGIWFLFQALLYVYLPGPIGYG